MAMFKPSILPSSELIQSISRRACVGCSFAPSPIIYYQLNKPYLRAKGEPSTAVNYWNGCDRGSARSWANLRVANDNGIDIVLHSANCVFKGFTLLNTWSGSVDLRERERLSSEGEMERKGEKGGTGKDLATKAHHCSVKRTRGTSRGLIEEIGRD